MTKLNLPHLKQLAQAAPQWSKNTLLYSSARLWVDKENEPIYLRIENPGVMRMVDIYDYIAALSPDVVLKLIERLERYEKALKWYARRSVTIHNETTKIDMTNAFTQEARQALEPQGDE